MKFIRNKCKNNGYNLIADVNIRNTKDPNKIKNKKMSYYK